MKYFGTYEDMGCLPEPGTLVWVIPAKTSGTVIAWGSEETERIAPNARPQYVYVRGLKRRDFIPEDVRMRRTFGAAIGFPADEIGFMVEGQA